jgi:hypothetical protein
VVAHVAHGDEKNVAVANCTYKTAKHPIDGKGTLKITALAGNQKSTKTRTGGKAVLLKGGSFTASFEVQTPAQPPAGSPLPPDPMLKYSGQGTFETTNTKFQGT